MALNAFDVRIQERRRDLSLFHLLSGIAKHHRKNKTETTSPTPLYAAALRRRPNMRTCYIHVGRCLYSHPFALVKLAISKVRMKAETLSWTRGFPTARRGFVHKSRQRYELIYNLQGERQNYFAQWKQNDTIVWNRLQCRETDTAEKGWGASSEGRRSRV